MIGGSDASDFVVLLPTTARFVSIPMNVLSGSASWLKSSFMRQSASFAEAVLPDESGRGNTDNSINSDAPPQGMAQSLLPGETKPEAARPHLPSLCIVMGFTFITVTCFTITLPTVQQYLNVLGPPNSEGAPQWLVGLVVGLTPFGAGIMQIPISFILQRYPMRNILIAYALILIFSQLLYAAATVTNTCMTLLVARIVAGLVSGPQLLTTYVARTTDLSNRSMYMLRVAITIAAGYAAGPLLGGGLESICRRLNWNIPDAPPLGTPGPTSWDWPLAKKYLLNAATLPGWAMALLMAVELCFIACSFREPPRPCAPERAGAETSRLREAS